MSWDAYLECECCGGEAYEANYTHNTNAMVDAALEKITGQSVTSWLDILDGMSSVDSIPFLCGIVEELESNHGYDYMNPPNGWGSRESLVPVLNGMALAARNKRGTLKWKVWR